MTCILFEGDMSAKDLSSYDIVLTTYGKLTSDFTSHKKLYQYNWFRVILDEAHYIKGRTTMSAKSAYSLKSQNRWAMTGSPIQNRLDDLFS